MSGEWYRLTWASSFVFIFNKISLLFHPIFLNLTCAYPYLCNLINNKLHVSTLHILLLSKINSGKRDEIIKKFDWKLVNTQKEGGNSVPRVPMLTIISKSHFYCPTYMLNVYCDILLLYHYLTQNIVTFYPIELWLYVL
jgi:hypothetical protein